MADHSVLMLNILTVPLIWTKLTIALAIIASPIMVQAALANMGSFRITSQNLNNGTVSGRYTAFGSATGTTSYCGFSITHKRINGYNSSVTFTPTKDNQTDSNGIEIEHE